MELIFRPLSLEKQNEYKSIFDQCPQKTSDYSFVNLWSWRNIYQLEWAWEEDLVWIRQNNPERIYWAPIGPWENIEWKKRLQRCLPTSCAVTRIPEYLYNLWHSDLPGSLNMADNRDHWDYVYSVQELIELKGNKYHKKKNLLSQFQKLYQASFITLTVDEIEGALALQEDWCLWRDCESSEVLSAENKAIVNAFKDWTFLKDVIGGGLVVNQSMISFTVAEPIDQETIVIHFEKGCPQYKGVYQAINQMFLSWKAQDYTYVNREQDLGDLGLRQAKESYLPVSYLKKYSGHISISSQGC